ncbi:galactose mutarotase [Alphaproteobacteria bacterium]|nr:galactose mutarotase [Alphaproteobacteria bacterium]
MISQFGKFLNKSHSPVDGAGDRGGGPGGGDQSEVLAIEIKRGGLRAKILTWGATLADLRLDGHDHPLVLGFREFEHYRDYAAHHGAIAGRVINRIAGAKATIDGTQYHFDTNHLTKHTLHGGAMGFGWRNWQLGDYGDDFVELILDDPDGSMGFPGNLTVTCRYSITEDCAFAVDLGAKTDAPTLVNLGHHSYFCLDDRRDIRTHELSIDADFYLPADTDDFATGEIVALAGSAFDFRQHRAIKDSFDTNFCLAEQRRVPTKIARLSSPFSGIAMDITTTEPGLQLYTAHKLDAPIAGLSGAADRAFAGVCLEPQMWPNAPAHPAFPSIELRPEDQYHQHSKFTFSRYHEPQFGD